MVRHASEVVARRLPPSGLFGFFGAVAGLTRPPAAALLNLRGRGLLLAAPPCAPGLRGSPGLLSRRRPCIESGGRWRRRFVLSVEIPAPFRGCSGQRRAGRGRVPPVVADGRRPLSRPTADVPARRAPSPPGAGGTKDGKDSVKGNRQGSLSRSITRRSDQNRKIKYCFLFCDFASACQKSPFGLF